jgi:hypothetical protein
VGLRVASLTFEPPDVSVARAVLIQDSAAARAGGLCGRIASRAWGVARLPAWKHAQHVDNREYADRGIVGQSMLIEMVKD